MDEFDNNSYLGMRRLSLIDVSSADDWLLNSPFDNQKEQKNFRILDATDDNIAQVSANSNEKMDLAPQPLNSSEPDAPKKNIKYNLRKSLAWDSAFFTSDGFLDAEELSDMMGNDENSEKQTGSAGKSNKLMLPPIQEFLHRSTDSLSTIASETLTLESSECDLFDDVRASIQKSSKKATNIVNTYVNKVGAGTAEERRTIRSSTKMDLAVRNRLKPKVGPKKPVPGIQGPGKVMKQVSQPVANSGRSAPLVSKQPKAIARGGPVSTISAKRTSLGANRVKIEKDSGIASGRIALPKDPALGSLRNMVPRPTVCNSRPSSISSATSKGDLRTSCSSFESSKSASSSSFTKSSINYLKKKNNVNIVNTPSKSTAKTPVRIAPKKKNQPQPGRPQLSPSISPASSISEWSVDSSSSASTVNLTNNSSRSTNLGKRFSVEGGSVQKLDSEKYSTQQSSVGSHTRVDESSKRASTGTGVLRPDSMKPTGLRMPSPKIGFFDGARSAGRTPNGSTQSHYGSLKVGSGSISPSGKLNNIKPAPQTSKPVGAKSIKSKSPLTFKEPTTKVSSALRNVKGLPISPEVQSITSLKIRKERDFKDAEKEKVNLENQVGCFQDEKSPAEEESADSFLPSHHQVSGNDNSIGPEKVQPSKILVRSENEDLPTNKIATVEVVEKSRIPFATKDSFWNVEGLLDLSTGETEKTHVETDTL